MIRGGRVLVSALFFYALLGVVYGNAHFLSGNGVFILHPHAWKLAAALLAGLVLLAALGKALKNIELRADVALFAVGFFALSDVASRRFGFFPPGTSIIEFWYLGAGAALLVYFQRGIISSKRVFSLPSLLLLQLLIAGLFLALADGRLLLSDDHPSFLYRLHLLKEHFPAIPFYNPQWNAGYSAR